MTAEIDGSHGHDYPDHDHGHGHGIVSPEWGRRMGRVFKAVGVGEIAMGVLLRASSLIPLGAHDLADGVSLQQQGRNACGEEIPGEERLRNRNRSRTIICLSALAVLAETGLNAANIRYFGGITQEVRDIGYIATSSLSLLINSAAAIQPMIGYERKRQAGHDRTEDDRLLHRHVVMDVGASGAALGGGIMTAEGVSPFADNAIGGVIALATAWYFLPTKLRDGLSAPFRLMARPFTQGVRD